MIWGCRLLVLLAWSTTARPAQDSNKCSPCCSQFRMQEALQLGKGGNSLIARQGAAPCHIEVFTRTRLHAALAHKWLYFVGDSSTRGLVLALYYELLGAKDALAALKLDRGYGALLKRSPKEEFQLAKARSQVLFQYGNASSIAECRNTLRSLARAGKWALETCEDFGDPCNVASPSGKSDEGLDFAVEDSVGVRPTLVPANMSFLSGKSGEVVKLDVKRKEAQVEFPDYYNPATGEMKPLANKPGHRSGMSSIGFHRTFALPLASLKRDMKKEQTHRCKRSRDATHSVASLHLGFLDAGFCNGKLVFTTVSSHDYTEGNMQAPLGSQVFPDRAKAFAERMRAGSRHAGEDGESCVRVTYRMLPQIAVFNNELNVYARGGSRLELAAAQSGPDPTKFVPTNDFTDEASDDLKSKPSSAPPENADSSGSSSSSSSSVSSSTKKDDSSHSREHSPRAGMRAYFADAKGLPDLLYLQAGGWDRAMRCLERRDFVQWLNSTAGLLAATAPGAALVLGTLPTGAAYPGDPRQEMARLQDQENTWKVKQRVVSCLRYNPGPLSFGASAEVAVRLSLVGLPLPKTSMPQAFRLVPHKEGEAMAAYEAEEHRKVVAGTALAQRATLEADVAATDALEAFFSRTGSAPTPTAAAAATALPQTSVSSFLPGEEGFSSLIPPANRTAADIWVFDRLPTWDALPESLQLLNSSRVARNFRRLHPSMLQNIWDVQRLVTGLLNTPAFLRPHSMHKHGSGHHHAHHTHYPHYQSQGGREKYRTRSVRDALNHRNSLRAAGKETTAATAASSQDTSSESEAAIAVPITELQAQTLQGYGNDDVHTRSESSSSSESNSAAGARHSFCTCSATLTVKNAHVCAPTQPMTEISQERPLGYPFKGRLGHWAAPCDYRADSL